MKTKLKAAILGMLAVLMLAACNKDEPDTSTPPEPPKGQRLVKSITMTEEGTTYLGNFYYQDGRISRIESSEQYKGETEFWAVHYSFEGNKININYDDGTKSTAILNDQGYVRSITGYYDQGNVDNFTYADNRMTSRRFNTWNEWFSYVWNDGNLVEASTMDKNGVKFYVVSCTYGNIANNPLCNLDMNFFNSISKELLVEGSLAVLGYCGLRSEKLISSEKRTNGKRVDITYTLDKDGFVTKIVYTYTYRGDIATGTHEIEYY